MARVGGLPGLLAMIYSIDRRLMDVRWRGPVFGGLESCYKVKKE